MQRPDSTATYGSVFNRLFRLSYPIIGLNVLNVLALAVDTMMCGRLPEAELALTALGFASQVVFLLLVAMLGLTVGTVALVARSFGAGEMTRVNHILQQSTICTLLLSTMIALIGNLSAPTILSWLGASGEVVEIGLQYLRPLLSGTVFSYLIVLYGAVLRGVGNTKVAFTIGLLTNALNVAFNYGLILGNYGLPGLGVQGAAIGTLLSQAVGVAIYASILLKGRRDGLKLKLSLSHIDVPLVRSLVAVGTPAALDFVILNAAFLSIVGMLGRIDEVAVAAHGIGLRIQALAFIPGLSVAQATGALVGQALGAGDAARARQTVKASLLFGTSLMTVLALIIVTYAVPIVALFDLEPTSKLGEFAIEWISLLGYGMPVAGVYISFIGMLQGSGKTGISLKINAFTTILLQIPLSAFLGFTCGLGPWGVWVAFPLGFIIKASLGVVVYRSGKWLAVGARV